MTLTPDRRDQTKWKGHAMSLAAEFCPHARQSNLAPCDDCVQRFQTVCIEVERRVLDEVAIDPDKYREFKRRIITLYEARRKENPFFVPDFPDMQEPSHD